MDPLFASSNLVIHLFEKNSMFSGPRVRHLRKFNYKFPTLTNKKIKEKKHRPGEHAFFPFKKTAVKRSFVSRLRDKQILKLIFCLSEYKLKNYIKFALQNTKTNPILGLYNMLHSRLDYILVRAHIAETIPQARQFINHGQTYVNSKVEKSPGYICKTGDSVTVKTRLAFENYMKYCLFNARSGHKVSIGNDEVTIHLYKPGLIDDYINLKLLKLIRSCFEYYI